MLADGTSSLMAASESFNLRVESLLLKGRRVKKVRIPLYVVSGDDNKVSVFRNNAGCFITDPV